jgi:hypothetical protein
MGGCSALAGRCGRPLPEAPSPGHASDTRSQRSRLVLPPGWMGAWVRGPGDAYSAAWLAEMIGPGGPPDLGRL